jgi:hypothetical protein
MQVLTTAPASQVRKRQEEMKSAKAATIEERNKKAEANREAHIGKVASKARLESRKVDEVAFIKSHSTDPAVEEAEERKAQLALKMNEAEERRKLHLGKQAAANAEREKAANERLLERKRMDDARTEVHTSKVDEAYHRWTEFTQSVADRAAQKSQKRLDVISRREQAELEEQAR